MPRPTGGKRGPYGSMAGERYQPKSLIGGASPSVANRSLAKAGGKKEILCAFGIDVDAVAGWLGSYGGEDSPCDISRGLFAG
ncbi:MAG: hypothetical protein AAGC86_18695, partial [Pseudomonadota bacterium]